MFDTLIEKLQNGRYITLETTPSHSPVFQPVIDKIKALGLDTLVDGFSTTDNPLAKLKYNAMFAALKLQNTFNKPVLATMSMRDRNRIALQSDLLGGNEFDIRAVLALTGDSAAMSDQPNAKGVFDGNSSLLLDIITCLNSGIDYAGKPLAEKPQHIFPFAVTNSFSTNPKTLQKKMKKKIEHGAIGLISQPVYGIDNAKLLLELLENAKSDCCESAQKAQIILGIFPITKLRTAQFLASHVPGIHVPKIWIESLRKAHDISPEEEYKVGFELSKNLFDEIMQLHPKVHLMTANQFQIAKDILV
ncbi:MAG: methylenetetrahydrofolate reductase [Campylobacterales bacterium]|nr:methylenetetrahydrofolate reductase [Campylobacterales bacterium]